MKELSVMEMNDVSGAYSWDFTNFWTAGASLIGNAAELVGSAALGAAVGGAAGAVIGGKHGGDGGGILGVGIIGQGVGMIGAGIIGSICFGITGALFGWDNTTKYAENAINGLINGTIY
ncbi:hypothetical protein ACMGEE_17650 [Erwinia sp. DT-104]|uniref:Colicin V synthesis protein n=1 Tax=Erwinia aeris TaxID=3239803 RepID=A0ABV4E5C4_9GAMM|nr:hypothetical protein [Erwinia sp. BC051422]MDN8542203.1 hypothetical protein [Erwinia sp. BC051422]